MAFTLSLSLDLFLIKGSFFRAETEEEQQTWREEGERCDVNTHTHTFIFHSVQTHTRAHAHVHFSIKCAYW